MCKTNVRDVNSFKHILYRTADHNYILETFFKNYILLQGEKLLGFQ